MYPVLFRIAGFTVYTYGLFIALAVGAVFFLVARDARRLGIPENVVNTFLFLLVIAGLVGGRLGYVITYWSYYRYNPLEIFLIRRGGLAFIGSLFGALSVGIYYLLYRRVAILPALDTVALYLPLGLAIGRVGCFFNNCCGGAPTGLPWGVVFPGAATPVHPSQLYESLLGLSIFAFFYLVFRRDARENPGRLTGWFFLLYGFGRFILDNFRAEAFETSARLYTTQRWALLVIFLGAALLLGRKKGRASWR